MPKKDTDSYSPWPKYPQDPHGSYDSDDTDPAIPLFSWDDIDLAEPVPIKKKAEKRNFCVKINVSWYLDEDRGERAASWEAIRKFLQTSKAKRSAVKYANVKDIQEVILFTHIKKIYIIEISSTQDAVKNYFINKKKYVGIK